MKPLKNILFFINLLLPFCIAAQNEMDTCTYQIQLIDFFGDGWDGASLEVVQNEDTSTYTLLDSTIRFIDIKAIQNERLQIFFKAGEFDDEIRYIVFDPSGEIIFNDGPFPEVGLAVDIIACPNCPIPTEMQINTSDNSALVSWNTSENALTYIIDYNQKESVTAPIRLTTSDTSITLLNLSPFTNYEAKVSVVCPLIGSSTTNQDTSLVQLTQSFTTRYAKDVGIASVEMPNSGCGLTNAEMIHITLQNYGATPQSLIPFRFSVNGEDGGVMIPSDGFFTAVLGKDSMVQQSFETTYDFSEPGIYNLAVWTELEGDSQTQNDTALLQVRNSPLIDQFPYSQDYELNDGFWYTLDNNNWRHGLTSQGLKGGQNSWLLENDSIINTELLYLYSPCFNFSALTEDPKLAFQLLLNTDDVESEFWVELSTNKGETWRRLDAQSNALNWYNNPILTAWDNSIELGRWHYVENQLLNTANKEEVQLRLVYKNGMAETSGSKVMVDDLQLFAPSTTNLVALNVQNLAPDGCGILADQIQLTLYNGGQNELSAIPVSYQINEGEIITEVTDTLKLTREASAIYTFKTTFNTSIPDNYSLKAWTNLANEALPISDTVYYEFSVEPPLPLPLVEDFEDRVVDEGWFAVGNAEVTIRGPQDHNNETFIMAVNLWSGANRTAIHTANYGSISEGDSLSFDYRMVLWDEPSLPLMLDGDSLIIEISTNCGVSFTPIYAIHADNHTTSVDFQKVSLDLSTYANQNATFRFRALWGHSDFWLDMDNITILPGLITTTIDEKEGIDNFRLFPNPSTGLVQLELDLVEQEEVKWQVINNLGQVIMEQVSKETQSLQQVLNLQSYPKGLYFVKLSIGNQLFSRKLILVE